MAKTIKSEYDLFEHQPTSCRQPLPYKEIEADAYIKRLVGFDPNEVYEKVRYAVNPYNRYNWQNITFATLFPKRTDGLCPCGCGQPVKVGQLWASKDCQMFVIAVWNIIGYREQFISFVYEKYFGNDKCMICHEHKWKDCDHIVPIDKGGGGAWLSNYQMLCEECHKEKTRQDFNWTKLKSK
jgi:5-methylcytosine-specific restriction endonuclease McrA